MTLDDEPFKGGDPKGAPRIRNDGATRAAKLRQTRCVLWPRCDGSPGLSGHHVVPKGTPHRGDDVAANLVVLCGSGTTGCHGDVEGRKKGARKLLGAYLVKHRPDTIAYVRGKLDPGGDAWLKTHYKITLKALKEIR